MSSIKKNIPNIFTLANLACGLLGTVWVFEGRPADASCLIWLAAAFDFLDGFLARMLKANTETGKQLDSLADLVSFGVLPSFIFFHLLRHELPAPWPYLAFATALCSALRLAKFNTDESQKTEFKGLPTPANALLVSSIPFILASHSFLRPVFSEPWSLLAISLVFSALLVSPITLFSLKFSHFKWRGNEVRWSFIAISTGLFILFKQTSIPLIIVSYLLLSLLDGKLCQSRVESKTK